MMLMFFLVQVDTISWGRRFANGEDISMLTLTIIAAGIFVGVFGAIKSAILFTESAIFSRIMHSKMVFRVIYSGVCEVLERMPLGRLINRFTGDIDILDRQLPTLMDEATIFFFVTFIQVTIVILSIGSVYFLIPLAIYLSICYLYRNLYMESKRVTVRMQAISKSPLVGWGASIILGAPEIRSLGIQDICSKRMNKFIEDNTKNGILINSLDSWFQSRIALSTLLFISIPAYSLLFYNIYKAENLAEFDAGKVVLFVTKSSTFSQVIFRFMMLTGFLESNLIAVERCLALENIPHESGYSNIEVDKCDFEVPKSINNKNLEDNNRMIASIENDGSIEIENVRVRYPSSVKAILSDLNLSIKPGERVGIIGRTGSGKSTLIKLLAGFLKPKEGRVLVGGADTLKTGLKELRRSIMVVSQKAFLFEGTLSENIDPFLTQEQKTTANLILGRLTFTEAAKGDLNFTLSYNGDNLTTGEKQKVAFIRAITLKKPIVIFDEITSKIDMRTELLFDELINTHIPNATLIIVSHKLSSVRNCDRVVVMDKGEIVEMGTPAELSEKEDGKFRQLLTIQG